MDIITGWVLFVCYGIVTIFFAALHESDIKFLYISKIAGVFFYLFLFAGILGLFSCILWVIGWIWYYFCGGFLVIDDGLFAGQETFFQKVLYGIMSLFLLGFVFCLLAVLGGAKIR